MASDGGPRIDERRASGVVGALVAGVVGVVSVFDVQGVDALDVLAIAAPAASYLAYSAVRRCPPLAPFAVSYVAVLGLNLRDLPNVRSEGAMFLLVLAVAHLALYEARRSLALACGLASVAAPVVLTLAGASDWSWQYWTLGIGFGWGFGELGYRLRLARDELARTRALVADQAALDERQRISRDIHDVLGQSLTIMMLQLTAARHLLRRDPDVADASLADAERVGRESLNQVRQTVGMLRADDPSERGSVSSSPTLEDLDHLLADCRLAGIPVREDVSGPISTLDVPRSVAGYRIVQEAMANVSKYAAGAETTVTVRVDAPGGACRIVVTNHGGRRDSRVPSGGFGLVGMRERARSVGGSVNAGPVADGWTVFAELPPLDDVGEDGA
jgi:signal transduction histidine kinase